MSEFFRHFDSFQVIELEVEGEEQRNYYRKLAQIHNETTISDPMSRLKPNTFSIVAPDDLKVTEKMVPFDAKIKFKSSYYSKMVLSPKIPFCLTVRLINAVGTVGMLQRPGQNLRGFIFAANGLREIRKYDNLFFIESFCPLIVKIVEKVEAQENFQMFLC